MHNQNSITCEGEAHHCTWVAYQVEWKSKAGLVHKQQSKILGYWWQAYFIPLLSLTISQYLFWEPWSVKIQHWHIWANDSTTHTNWWAAHVHVQYVLVPLGQYIMDNSICLLVGSPVHVLDILGMKETFNPKMYIKLSKMLTQGLINRPNNHQYNHISLFFLAKMIKNV